MKKKLIAGLIGAALVVGGGGIYLKKDPKPQTEEGWVADAHAQMEAGKEYRRCSSRPHGGGLAAGCG